MSAWINAPHLVALMFAAAILVSLATGKMVRFEPPLRVRLVDRERQPGPYWLNLGLLVILFLIAAFAPMTASLHHCTTLLGRSVAIGRTCR